MTPDEREIRQVVETWFAASRRGDTAAVLDLITDDALFMVPGQGPFGKAVFAAASKAMEGVQINGESEIVELQVLGDWAFIRNHIDINAALPDGRTVHRAGYTLTLLRKETDGQWRLARDANLLTVRD